MRWMLALALSSILAAPALAADKPIKPEDFSRLMVLDLRIALAREQFEKFHFQLQAEVLRLQIQDGTTLCQLNQEKRTWMCPDPEKGPSDGR